MIREALATLFEPGAVVEVRMLNTSRGTVSGYFDDMDKLAETAERYSGRAPAVYVTLNECRPDLLARARNRVREFARETTSDDQIIRRRWLPVDFDPVRPSGISATNAEHEAALARAIACREWLRQQGWPEPLLADSGNGGHLLYALDLPNADEAGLLLRRVLAALAFRFDDAGVQVDQVTYNAARIWKLYGTLACKGDDMPDRPHRLSEVLEGYRTREIVSPDQLGEIARQIPEEPRQKRDTNGAAPFELENWIRDRGLSLEGMPWQGGRKWVFAECPWNPQHTDRSAYIVQFPSGAVWAGCHHNGCKQNHWHELRDRLEPGWRDRIPQNGARLEPSIAVVSDRPQSEPFVASVASFRTNTPPKDLEPEALYGLPGDVVRTIEPHTESAPSGILASFLIGAGYLIGRGPHVYRDGAKHYCNEFGCLVGVTAKGRKGSATRRIDELFLYTDNDKYTKDIVRGIGSGEALVEAVADEEGAAFAEERRALVVETEFSKPLKVMSRDGSTLSDTLRAAWDGDVLANRTKGKRLEARNAHVSILGHTTEDDLRRYLNATDIFNGFANRFLWFCTHRSKSLPFGGGDAPTGPVVSLLHSILEYSNRLSRLEFDDETKELWDAGGLYDLLVNRPPGLLGAVTSRAEVHVTRLALLYAVLDAAGSIRSDHLLAALAVWDFSERSCAYIFGTSSGDDYADTIAELLAEVYPGGLTRTEIRDRFGRHAAPGRIPKALEVLESQGKAEKVVTPTGGRPTEYWRALFPENCDKSAKSPLVVARGLLA